MGFRFRQRIKIAPGIYINITKRGVSSASIGGDGLTLNVGGKRGPVATVSAPGTGLSYSASLRPTDRPQTAAAEGSPRRTRAAAGGNASRINPLAVVLIILASIFVILVVL